MGSEALARACELAFVVAREGIDANPPIEPPAAMRSFLYVPQLPRRAMSVAQRVIDQDPAFRARVAAQATEDNVGAEGYRWLHRPSGWDAAATTTAITTAAPAGASASTPAPVPPVPPPPAGVTAPGATSPATESTAAGTTHLDAPPPPPPPPPGAPAGAAAGSGGPLSIEDELVSLRGLVSRLADERRSVASEAATTPGTATPAAAGVVDDSQIEAQRAQLASAQEALAAALQERDRLAVERDELQADQTRLHAELGEARELLTDALHRLESGLQTEQTLRDQLDVAVGERDVAWQETAALRVEHDQVRDQLQVAEQARADLEAQLEEVSGHWQELKVELRNLTEEHHQAEQTIDELRAGARAAATQRRELFNDLAAQLGQVETERDRLAGQVEAIEATVSSTRQALEAATGSLTGEVSGIEESIAAGHQAVAGLDEALEQTHRRLAQLDGLIDDRGHDTDAPAAEVPAADEGPAAEVEPAEVQLADEPAGDAPPTTEPAMFADDFAAEAPALEETAFEGTAFGEAAFGETAFEEAVSATDEPGEEPAADDAERFAAATDDETQDEPLAAVMASHGFGPEEDPAETAHLPAWDDVAPTGADAWDDTPEWDDNGGWEDTAGWDTLGVERSVDTGSAAESTAPVTTATVPDISEAQRVVTTADIVVLVDGDPMATLGWRESPVAQRRGFLLDKLAEVTAEHGAAFHVVFDPSVGSTDQLPEVDHVRRSLASAAVGTGQTLVDLADYCAGTFPVAVVTDQLALRDNLHQKGYATLSAVELLDLIALLPEYDEA